MSTGQTTGSQPDMWDEVPLDTEAQRTGSRRGMLPQVQSPIPNVQEGYPMTDGYDGAEPLKVSDPALQEDADFRAHILDCLHDGVYFVDLNRRITYWNQGAERITGFSAQDVVGSFCYDNILAHVDAHGCQLCVSHCPLVAAIEQGRLCKHDLYLRHKRGHRVPVSVRAAPMKDQNGNVIGAVEVFSDSTREKAVEQRVDELETIAFHDPLTSLLNRRYLSLKVQQSIQEIAHFKRSFGLIFLDIDHFKQINDTWGHKVGDVVLQTISETLLHSLRSNDVVGRWGGEEFVAILADVTPAMLKDLAERCRQLIAECSVPVRDSRIQATVSIGATMLSPLDRDEQAIERADRLMYRSKATRNRTTVG